MNTKMTGFRWSLRPCALHKSSLSIGRVNSTDKHWYSKNMQSCYAKSVDYACEEQENSFSDFRKIPPIIKHQYMEQPLSVLWRTLCDGGKIYAEKTELCNAERITFVDILSKFHKCLDVTSMMLMTTICPS